MNAILQIVDAASTPLLAILCWQVYQIMTNHLPHIYERLGKIEGVLKGKNNE